MTLTDATAAMLAAIDAEDLDALASALAARAIALGGCGALLCEGPEAFEAGERVRFQLERLKQRWAAEGGRLNQLQSVFTLVPGPPSRVLHG